MNHIATAKYVNILDPVSLGSGTITSDTNVDTNGYDYLTIIVSTGASAGISALKIEESANSDLSSGSDVAVLGTTANIDGSTSAVPSSGNDEIHVFNIDLRGRKRYLGVTATSGGTVLCSILGILTKASEVTNVLADRGATAMVDV